MQCLHTCKYRYRYFYMCLWVIYIYRNGHKYIVCIYTRSVNNCSNGCWLDRIYVFSASRTSCTAHQYNNNHYNSAISRGISAHKRLLLLALYHFRNIINIRSFNIFQLNMIINGFTERELVLNSRKPQLLTHI